MPRAPQLLVGIAVLASPAPCLPAAAQEVRVAALRIEHPVLRVASQQSKTGAGYLVITNRGQTPDRLLAVETTASNRADLHGTVAVGTVMQMRSAAGGVLLPPGRRVTFAPGGLHVMFIGLKTPLAFGASVKTRLRFAKAGAVDVLFTVESATAAARNQRINPAGGSALH